MYCVKFWIQDNTNGSLAVVAAVDILEHLQEEVVVVVIFTPSKYLGKRGQFGTGGGGGALVSLVLTLAAVVDLVLL